MANHPVTKQPSTNSIVLLSDVASSIYLSATANGALHKEAAHIVLRQRDFHLQQIELVTEDSEMIDSSAPIGGRGGIVSEPGRFFVGIQSASPRQSAIAHLR
jgi:hypothetical protein